MLAIFIYNLEHRLKCINGHVKVTVYTTSRSTILNVHIDNGLFQWLYTVNNIDTKINAGTFSGDVAMDVIKAYRKCVLNHFFR